MTSGGGRPGFLSYSSTSRYISHLQTSLEFSCTSSKTEVKMAMSRLSSITLPIRR